MSEKVRTLSVSKGRGYIPHNVRAFTPANSVPERTHLNRTYVHEELADAYEFLFGDAVRAYDEKQKRADRKIGSSAAYLARMKGKDDEGSKNGEQPFHEIIVQVGDMHDMGSGTPDGDLAVRILDEYARSFRARNPRLHLVGMYMHLDEATPHLHVDFIPVADGYKTGMFVRNGLDRALKQQGVSAGQNNRKSNATIAWQDQERDALEEIMKKYGIARADPSGSDRKGIPIGQYRAMAEELQEQIARHPVPKAKKALGGGVKLSEEEWQNVASMHQLSQQLAASADQAIDTANRKIREGSYLRSAAERALDRAAAVEHRLPELQTEIESMRNQNASLAESLADMRAMSAGALISVQYVYSAMNAVLNMLDPGDDLSLSVMSALKQELLAALSALGGSPDVPKYGYLSPLAGTIAEHLISAGASVRFDNLKADGTASVIADMPDGSQSVTLASGVPDFAAAKQLLGQIPVIRNVRTRREYLADAKAIVTPMIQVMSLDPDTPREQIRSMMESVGVVPVIDRDAEADRWNILMPRSFAPGLKKQGFAGEEVSAERLADFWLPGHFDAVQLLDRTAQVRANERMRTNQKVKPAPVHRNDWER